MWLVSCSVLFDLIVVLNGSCFKLFDLLLIHCYAMFCDRSSSWTASILFTTPCITPPLPEQFTVHRSKAVFLLEFLFVTSVLFLLVYFSVMLIRGILYLFGTLGEFRSVVVSFHGYIYKICQRTTKPTIRSVWSAKTQISLYIYPVWQGFSFITLWIAWRLLKAHSISEDSDQTARMRSLIWIFAYRTSLLVVFVVRWLKLCNLVFGTK